MVFSNRILCSLLMVAVFCIHTASCQHWSYGWLPGGKRDVDNMDTYLEVIKDGDGLQCCEDSQLRYLFQNINFQEGVVADAPDRRLKKIIQRLTTMKRFAD